MIVHLVDGTYELFRHFYGLRRAKNGDPPFGAVRGSDIPSEIASSARAR